MFKELYNKIKEWIMSLYLGANSSNSPVMHLTSSVHTESELKTSLQSDTIFHSSNMYLSYTNTGESGSITPNPSNRYKFTVTFSATVASAVFSGQPVLVLFKRTDSAYYQLSYSPTNSFYTTASSASVFTLSVNTTTSDAYTNISSVIAITFSEKTYSVNNIRIDSSGVFLDGSNVLINNYAISTSTLHNNLDTSLKLSDSLFLQLYNTSGSWTSGIKFEASTNTISRNSVAGYIPILSPEKKLTTITKYSISSSTHNSYGTITAQLSPSFTPSSTKKYMTVIKCYDDLGGKYIYFNCLLEGLAEQRIIAYQGYPNPTVYMGITLNSNASLTLVFFFRGFGEFPDVINNRIINASGYIYEFK